MGFKKFDGSTWQAINPKKLKGIPYTGTLPATLTGTKAGYLHRYKIYGNTEQTGTPTPENPIVPQECGERTENLYNKTDSSMNFIGYIFLNSEKYVVTTSSRNSFSIIVPVEPNTTYTIVKPKTSRFRVGLFTSYPYVGETTTAVYGDRDGNGVDYGTSLTFTTSNDTSYILAFIRNYDDVRTTNEQMKNSTMVCEGSTAPPYEPYGYKLPLASGNTPVDIYIGDYTLSTEEYVDSGTGKIYRMVGGVLTPTDPPIPFPQIPTSANSTTISWAGEGLAPSEFDSIQEWVDIPTYKRVNGAWAEDN